MIVINRTGNICFPQHVQLNIGLNFLNAKKTAKICGGYKKDGKDEKTTGLKWLEDNDDIEFTLDTEKKKVHNIGDHDAKKVISEINSPKMTSALTLTEYQNEEMALEVPRDEVLRAINNKFEKLKVKNPGSF